MTLKNIQDDVEKWTAQYTPQYWKPYEILARLMEEVGELSREVNHEFGPKKKKPGEPDNSIGQEISDIVFTLVCMANSQGINLQDEWDKMVEHKMYGRDKDRYAKKE